MEATHNPRYSYLQFQSRWRHSINQLSKLEEESKLSKLDKVCKRTSTLKLKMKNRLGQIDDEFNPIFFNESSLSNQKQNTEKQRVASTNHDTNVFTVGSNGTNLKLQESLIVSHQELNPEEFDQNLIYKCHQIREELIQELTEYNQSKYSNQMKLHCSKYNESLKSVFYSIINHPKQQLYEFCYMCDEIIHGKNPVNLKAQPHICKSPLTSISNVQQALMKIKTSVKNQNNKIFHVFLHIALQPEVNIGELISNVTVLKQSLEHQYEPEEAVLRLRLMNLIGKKIGLLMEEKELENRLNSIWKSKKC